jgi:ADP-ribose pyrophosphatase
MLAKMFPTPAYCGECIYIYLARGLTPAATGQDLDEGEVLEIVRVPFAKAYEMCKSGEITDAKTLVGIFKYADQIEVR